MDQTCDVCHCLTFNSKTKRRLKDVMVNDLFLRCYRPQAEIRDSGTAGCRFCKAILKAIEAFRGEDWSTPLLVLIQLNLDGRCIIYMSPIRVQLYCPPDLPPAWDGVLVAAELPTSSFSQSSFDFIRDNLEHCYSQHTACKQLDAKLPKRLIDIHSQDDKFRIIETEPGYTGQYIALSYCWGGSKFLTKTTADTISDWRSLSDLPRTIKDAVMVTKALGVRYLWVDALCIIQDSTEDWVIQSSRMGSVYRNAYVTIAASSARSADVGFLGPFDSRFDRKTIKIPWTNHSGNDTILKLRRSVEHHCRGLYDQPLLSRAWSFQERLLSTRVVSFGNNELRWNCISSETCQCRSFQAEDNVNLESILRITTLQEACSKWHDIVTGYSARHLTYPRDRLPALSGIAHLFREFFPGPYIAGLWLPTLIQGLCWQRDWQPIWSVDSDYIAPTFTWASVCGSALMLDVEHYARSFVEKCFIISAETSTSDSDPYGQVKGGSIQIHGSIVTTKLISGPNASGRNEHAVLLLRASSWGPQYSIVPDTHIDTFTFLNERGETETSICRSRTNATIWKEVDGTPVHLFLLGICNRPSTDIDSTYRLCWLVLGRSSRNLKFYERVGFLNVYLIEVDRLQLEDMIKGTRTETITIV